MSPEQLQSDRNLRFADWGDFPFRPAIERSGEIYELPRPVTSLVINDVWDGDTTVGTTRNGVDITLKGEIGSVGETILSPAEMFAALAELRANLHVGPDDAKFRFFLYHDTDAEIYRFFESCTASRLKTDLTNPKSFRFELAVHADDPTLYDELPEEE